MGRLRGFLLALLVCFPFLYFVHGQSQDGFISIDCGSESSYIDRITGLNFVSDSGFVDTGIVMSISTNYTLTALQEKLWHVRSFPQGSRNCYNVRVKPGTKHLIRASFLYANYDGLRRIPEFDLYFGPNFWTTVTLKREQSIIEEEIIHITTSDHVQVCLINTDNGTPFISALELRPLAMTSYKTVSGSLATHLRLDYGANGTFTRFPDDVYDRVWRPPIPNPALTSINTSSPVSNQDQEGFKVPSMVLKTSSTVINESAPMILAFNDPNQSNQFYAYMHFAEVQMLMPNQSRIFRIYINDEPWLGEDYAPQKFSANVLFTRDPLPINETYIFKLIKTEGSTLPPILNAVEIYRVINFSQSATYRADVDAIGSIKKIYKVIKNWEGDPCAPRTFAWESLNCSYDGLNPPRITYLNLSSSGLTGEISTNISNLAVLEVLDLSNNSLSGPVLDFFANMPLLRVLNLSGNNLSGQVPAALIDKNNKGSLSLSLDGNPSLYVTTPSEKKKSNAVIPAVGAVVGVLVFLILIFTLIYFIRRKRNPKGPEPLEAPRRQYSYSDILKITNNFSQMLGEGGFGKVYYGRMGNDTEVAVKMLSPKSAQGYREFEAEVDLLLRVHHRNLTSLVGYCNEGEIKMGLVYEYMGKGNLESLLFGEGEVLRWEARLQIALDSAQGLEYLHNGCRPPIIHRDIKSSNILLNEKLQAKLADFGLSKAFLTDGDATHVTTRVVGTLGYLDPEYYASERLTAKSDVYSFGIVLLELITGRRRMLSNIGESIHILDWIDSYINQGDIYSVIDPQIKDGCNTRCVWKAVDIAKSCTAPKSADRLTMNQVVNQLKECLNFGSN